MPGERAPNLWKVSVLALTGCLALCAVVGAQSVEPELFPPAVEPRPATPPPLRLAEREAVAPLAVLDPAMDAAPTELAEIADWNRDQKLPLKNGFSRRLPLPGVVTLDPAAIGPRLQAAADAIEIGGGVASLSAAGDLIWGAEVRVEGAFRLRLHLAEVDLPSGSLLWVYNDKDERVGPIDVQQLLFGSELWTPSVAGPTIRLELLLPADELNTHASLAIDRVLEILSLDSSGVPRTGLPITEAVPACFVDAQCVGSGTFSPIENVQRAIAFVTFVDGGSGFQCSGGLLADTDTNSTIPYLLTANHCIDKQSIASTVTAYFDYHTSSCNGSVPSLSSRPRSNGSTLLATGSRSSSSDFTLLRLDNLPPDRFLLGWDARSSVISNGKTLHRVSHPEGEVQHYSRTHVVTSGPTCENVPRSRFIYSSPEQGGTLPGSSGSPVLLGNGKVVGQLLGSCVVDDAGPCDPLSYKMDGAFFVTWDKVKDYLDLTKYTLTVNKTGNGSGTVTSSPSGINCGNTCSSEYTDGTSVELTATAASGSSFAGWGGDCNANGEVTVTSNKTCTATFSRPILTVHRTGTGNGSITSVPLGLSCGTVCSAAFNLGTSVELLATPAADSAFDGWTGDADCGDGMLTMADDRDCTASFLLLPTHTLNLSTDGTGLGTVGSDPGEIDCGAVCEDTFVEGRVVRLVAVPELGSQLGGWSGDADCTDGLVTMDDDRTCVGTFDPCTIDNEVLVPAQTVAETRLFQACNVLTVEEGGFVVADGGDATLRAGNSVVIPANFVVETGGRLTVVIGPPLPE
ncbi:MAG: hypothetical protein EP299_02945 [Acidobacteria bacterium]|nr:MAG: hypothetical protein EP299_02945 [Acidobacteriota bacterium]